jgi:hypothetical protein
MTAIDSTIGEFIKSDKNIDTFTDFWRANYTLDFVEEYWKAFDHFEEVQAAQARIDNAMNQLKLDLAVAALTICSGGVVGALLGEIAVRQAAGRVVLEDLCLENMQKTLRMARLYSRNKVLEFAVGKAGEEIKNIATQEVKKTLNGVYMDVPVGQAFIEKPHTKQYIMEKFLVKNRIGIRNACKALTEAQISSREKERLFKDLRQSRFCNPPKQKVLPNKYYRWIELTFYLKMVLSSDWVVTYQDNLYGFRSSYKRTPINAAPDSKRYPENSITYKRGFCTRSTTRVEYDQIGQEFIDRMNDLYKELFPGDYHPLIDSRLFGERTSRQILAKAYRTLKMVGQMNAGLVSFKNGIKRS